MRKQFASLAVLAIAFAAGAAEAQTRGTIAFELQGEAVRPADLTQTQKPDSALGQTHHWGYNYNQCYNYYRWVYNAYYGWQRYYVGTRCY
jgi:hypothetical protein